MTRGCFFAKIVIVVKKDSEKIGVEEKNSQNNEMERNFVYGLEKPAKQNLFSRIKSKIEARREKKLAELNSKQLSEEETKIVEEKIVQAQKEVAESKKNTKKKKITTVVFFIFNIVIVAGILTWNILSSDNFTPLSLLKLNFGYLLLALFFLLLIVFVDTTSIHRMLYRKTLRSRWILAYKSFATLRYYDSVTPFAAGGQPFMIGYLTSRDVPGATALATPLSKLLFQNISWLFVTGICLVISFTNHMSSVVSILSVAGFIITLFMVSMVLFLSISKKAGSKVVSWCIRFLCKIRLLKDYDKNYTKVITLVEDYQKVIKEYSKARYDLFLQFVLNIARVCLLFSIPYFICMAFGAEGVSFFECFVCTALIELAASFIPLPGGTGMNELSFTVLFSGYLAGNTFWALLAWRFCSYYFYLIQGLIVVSYDTVIGNKKYCWTRKCRELQSESQEFRRKQIENFRMERDKRRRKGKM